jgi:predicted small lipoprotein YifL
MKKLLTIFAILAAVMLISACQKELPDSIKSIDVNQGEQNPSPTPTPDNPNQQGDIPSEGDNSWPGY